MPIEGVEHAITSDGFFELEEVPKRVSFFFLKNIIYYNYSLIYLFFFRLLF